MTTPVKKSNARRNKSANLQLTEPLLHVSNNNNQDLAAAVFGQGGANPPSSSRGSPSASPLSMQLKLTHEQRDALLNHLEEMLRDLSEKPELTGAALVKSIKPAERRLVGEGLVGVYLMVAAA